MKNLTQEQRTEIALEEYGKEPIQIIAQLAILKLGELGVSTKAENVTQSCKATIFGKKYNLKMVISYEEDLHP